MHTIHFSPQGRSDLSLDNLAWSGDVLTINGAALDLSGIPEGASLPGVAVDHPLVIGVITREGGALSLVLRLPHADDASEAVRFPKPVTTGDGRVPIPETHPEPAS